MATHKATFSVTCDGNGQGYSDVSLKLPSTLVRHAQLVMVTVDVSDAIVSKTPSVTISQLEDVSAETWNDSVEDYELGDQLFFIDLGSTGAQGYWPSRAEVYEFDPRNPVINTDGSTPTYATVSGQELIRTKRVRCEVYNGGVTSNPLAAAADIYTVTMYYETAGDYRF